MRRRTWESNDGYPEAPSGNYKDKKIKTSDIKRILTAPPPKQIIRNKDLLSSGSTILNLACTERPVGAYPRGKYILIVGDSFAGKTFLTLTAAAESRRTKRFKHYRIILDDSEDGDILAKAEFFGQRVVDTIEPPEGTPEDPVASFTAETFYDYVDDAEKRGDPFIYIKDSENSLTTEADVAKTKKQRAARVRGVDSSGSFGVDKAKVHSARLRVARAGLRKSGSILFILSQTRDRIGFGSQFDPKTRSGGTALKFYADLELWMSIKGQITKTVRGIKRQQGIIAQIKIKKNRITGKTRSVLVPIYNTHGIDDTGSMVLWLTEEKHWKWASKAEVKGFDLYRKLTAPEFRFTGTYEALIQKIEGEGREQELRDIVVNLWGSIEDECVVNRKRRYV